jgi:hypothetical protein
MSSEYEHFGFQYMEDSSVHGTGVTVYALRRPSTQYQPLRSSMSKPVGPPLSGKITLYGEREY